jgi:hypothetical protein
MKTVGRKPSTGGLEAASGFLEMIVALRGDKPFLPKGVYRFKSFEEADQWSLEMMTRQKARAPQQ